MKRTEIILELPDNISIKNVALVFNKLSREFFTMLSNKTKTTLKEEWWVEK